VEDFQASVIIPCRNAESTVGDTVASVMAQTLSPHEVIVVDDASNDHSAERARNAGAKVINCSSRRNAGGARNAALEVAEGNTYAFLDADVVVTENWLERACAHFARDDSIAAVGGRIVNGRPGRYGELDRLLNHSEWMSTQPGPKETFPTMAVVYRGDAVGEIRFPETNVAEDTVFARSVLANGGMIWFDPEIVITHNHRRLDWRSFWSKQATSGEAVYWARRLVDRPGQVLLRFPALLLLVPHLWIVIARAVRAGLAIEVVKLFPWLVAGEIARIRGFFKARRDDRALQTGQERRNNS
jgi:glycosyltransferase involved in cell wall biosynthesis